MAAPQPPARRDPVLDYLTSRRDNLMSAIPQALQGSVTWVSIIQGIGLAMEKNPRLRQCNPRTIYASILYGLRLGLDPSGQTGEFALVPYKGVCTGQIMAYGKLRLAYRFGGITSHSVKVIHEHDEYDFDEARDWLTHKRQLAKKRGKAIGAYFRWWRHGGVDKASGISDGQELMDRDEFEQIKKDVKSRNNGKLSPAYQYEDEMFKRSVISRGTKHIDKSPDLLNLMAEAREEYKKEAQAPYIDVTIDEAGEVVEARTVAEARMIPEQVPDELPTETRQAEPVPAYVDPETGEEIPPDDQLFDPENPPEPAAEPPPPTGPGRQTTMMPE